MLLYQTDDKDLTKEEKEKLPLIYKIANQKGYPIFLLTRSSTPRLYDIILEPNMELIKITLDTLLVHVKLMEPSKDVMSKEIEKRDNPDTTKLKQIRERIEGLKQQEKLLEEKIKTSIITELSNA